jgi:RRXRR protein
MFVPVIDRNQHPLMPTTPSRARRWIKSGKATAFWKGGLFCVRLNAEPSAREVQPLAVGIDPESLREGYSVLSAAHTYLNIQAEARDGVKDAEQASTRMRRFVVEDIKARTQGKRRWDQSFSPLEVGKQWFYVELGKLAPVQTKQGYETKALREQLGLKKTSKKLAEVWHAHCVDAWVLAYSAVGGRKTPDTTRLVCIAPLNWHHRQLHRFEPGKGGTRKPYGGTVSLGIKRGMLVKHPRCGKAYVGGTMDGKLSLHDPQTGKRLTQAAKVTACQPIKLLRWRTRLLPLSPPK